MVDAVVLRGLPFDEHDRLVAVGQRHRRGRFDLANTGHPTAIRSHLSSAAPQNYMDWAAQQQVFESIAAIAGGAVPSRAWRRAEDLRSQRVTADFFKVLRVQPALGRGPVADEEVDGRTASRYRATVSGGGASARIRQSSDAPFLSKVDRTRYRCHAGGFHLSCRRDASDRSLVPSLVPADE